MNDNDNCISNPDTGKSTFETMISVSISKSRIVTLSTYVGLVDYGIRNARKLTKELENRWPKYSIWTEKYSGYYEIEVEETFRYSSVDALHRHVMEMAEMTLTGYELGKHMLGEVFHR